MSVKGKLFKVTYLCRCSSQITVFIDGSDQDCCNPILTRKDKYTTEESATTEWCILTIDFPLRGLNCVFSCRCRCFPNMADSPWSLPGQTMAPSCKTHTP